MFIVGEVDTCLEKPNGELYHKLTKNAPTSYFKRYRSNWLAYDKNSSPFYTTGYYNQYDHKVVGQVVQYKFSDDTSITDPLLDINLIFKVK